MGDPERAGDVVWNLLDFTIVAGGIVDQWLMPAIALVKVLMGEKSGGHGNMGQIMTMLRMARLLRILRLVRLIKSIPPLYTLVVGIVEAFQGMMWVMVLTVLVLYVFSLLGVKLVGHGLLFGGTTPPSCSHVFPTGLDSGFNLFKAMNGDWEALTPLFMVMPLSEIIFCGYMVISNWAILSILTAVVSENMLNTTEKVREEAQEEQDRKDEERSEVKLEELFKRVDHDESGFLTQSEFNALVKQKTTLVELQDATNMEKTDLKDLFKFLAEAPPQKEGEGADTDFITTGRPDADDDEDNGLHIPMKKFIRALHDEKNEVHERFIMRLEKRLRTMESTVRTITDHLPQMQKNLTEHRQKYLRAHGAPSSRRSLK